jgi:sarcosine oxidase
MSSVTRTEFAVIGGGLTGLAAAWALRQRGRDVVVVEQARVGHEHGGSHGACRIFRLGYDDPEYVALAAQARELWTGLEEACGERLLHPTPQLTFGPHMPQVRAAMIEAGASCMTLAAQDAAERFPGIVADDVVLLEPESAVIAADRTLAALVALAGEIREGERVTAVADDGRRVRVSTDTATIEAGCAIICAGPWTASLLTSADIGLPASATLEQVAYLEPATGGPQVTSDAMPIFVHYGGEFPYGLPVPGSGRYKIGIHHGGPAVDPEHQDHTADAELGRRIEQAASAFLTGFDPRPVTVERCVYDNSPDEDFVVDRIGNVVIGSGTSGHGFKFGPLLGEWLAFLATGSSREPGGKGAEIGPPPGRFALSRFKLRGI